jgi:UDP-glucose 4-epimerase
VIKDKKILITGGAGFIGSSLALVLAQHSNQIILYDNLSRNTYKYTELVGNTDTSLVEGDVLDFERLRSTMVGVDIVIHAAAIAGIDTVIKSPVRTMEVNMLGTANVLRAAHEVGVLDRVLDFSTSEIFGTMAFRVSETANAVSGSAGEARWVYAVSKLAGEHLSLAYHKEFDLPTVTVRPFNVYGPGQIGEGAIQVFVKRAIRNEDLVIYGDGSQIRAWCYIDDMVEGLLLALESPRALGESFNIGNPRAVTTIFGLAQAICRILDSKSKIIFKDPLSADVELRVPETQKAYELLGFRAKIDLEEGIKRTALWYKGNRL